MSSRDITRIEEGVGLPDDDVSRKVTIDDDDDEGLPFCSSTSVVAITQKVPLYILAQMLGSILASGTLYLVFDVTKEAYFGTVPVGSNVQSLASFRSFYESSKEYWASRDNA
ncbi:probable aquaporin nip4-2 [Phtheirospermum japonicum]|uniref:Probable aquaporin nip4-2 n=1 Tax=Phtheirospermum japonicum TaxID=374723 RepID=A0A830BY16_9LAMI|nr:probable aquaporin nip4-2 [Phtheirospermum japonicum]